MPRAHLQRPVLDSAGNVRLNAVVRVLEPNSSTPIAQAIYVADGGQETLTNPHTFQDGVVNFYLNTPQRVRLGIRFGSGAEFFYEDIDILPVDHRHASADVTYEPLGTIITSDNVQGALQSLEALLDPETADFALKDEVVESTVGTVLPTTDERLAGDFHTLTNADPTVPPLLHVLVDVAGVLTWVDTGEQYLTEEEADALFLTEEEAGELFLTEEEADAKYAPAPEDQIGVADPETGEANTVGTKFTLQTVVAGDLVVAENIVKPGLRVPVAGTAHTIVARVDDPPTGGPITIEVRRFNGGVFADNIGIVTIAAGSTLGVVTGLAVPAAKGDILKFRPTAVGTTSPGADINLSVDFK